MLENKFGEALNFEDTIVTVQDTNLVELEDNEVSSKLENTTQENIDDTEKLGIFGWCAEAFKHLAYIEKQVKRNDIIDQENEELSKKYKFYNYEEALECALRLDAVTSSEYLHYVEYNKRRHYYTIRICTPYSEDDERIAIGDTVYNRSGVQFTVQQFKRVEDENGNPIPSAQLQNVNTGKITWVAFVDLFNTYRHNSDIRKVEWLDKRNGYDKPITVIKNILLAAVIANGTNDLMDLLLVFNEHGYTDYILSLGYSLLCFGISMHFISYIRKDVVKLNIKHCNRYTDSALLDIKPRKLLWNHNN